MARVGKNVLTRGISGKLGDQLVFRQKGLKTIIATAPGKRTQPLSDAQNGHLQQFREAVLYAKSSLLDPVKKAEYQAAAKNGATAFNTAVADYLKLPVIVEMDSSSYTGQVGNNIKVRAIDNFKIKNVSVAISMADNTLLESGPATAGTNGLDWFYITTKKNTTIAGSKIVAIATDTPGHQAQKTQIL